MRDKIKKLKERLGLAHRPGVAKAVILLYHRVLPDRGEDSLGITVALHHFRSHLAALDKGYNVIPMGDLVKCSDLPPGSVVISFDDGYRDSHEYAFPALKAAGMIATFFVPTDVVGRRIPLLDERLRFVIEKCRHRELRIPDRDPLPLESPEDRHLAVHKALRFLHACSEPDREEWLERWSSELGAEPYGKETIHLPLLWEQIREMHEKGMTIGSHGRSHRSLAALSLQELIREVQGSARRLEEQLGEKPRFFSYPYGRPRDVTPRVIDSVRDAGYQLACTASPGPVFNDGEPCLLRRMEVLDWPGKTFTRELQRTFRMKAPAEVFCP